MQRGSKLKEYVEERGRGVFTLQVLGSLDLFLGPSFFFELLGTFPEKNVKK